MRVYAATTNLGKLRELGDLFRPFSWDVVAFEGYVSPIEGETSYRENATLKAHVLATQLASAGTRGAVVADDSGLEVAALDGRPGVLSARYGGEYTPWPVRRQSLLDEMAAAISRAHSATEVPASVARPESFARSARFVCSMHFIGADGREFSAEASVDGSIAFDERGDRGFGYDAIFYYPPLDKTFAELTEEEKNSISHRAIAARTLAARVKTLSF